MRVPLQSMALADMHPPLTLTTALAITKDYEAPKGPEVYLAHHLFDLTMNSLVLRCRAGVHTDLLLPKDTMAARAGIPAACRSHHSFPQHIYTKVRMTLSPSDFWSIYVRTLLAQAISTRTLQ